MTSPEFSISRKGDVFTVGNDSVGYKSFRLKVSRGGKALSIGDEAVEQVAARVFSILQSSSISFNSLEKTKITSDGIKTDQLLKHRATVVDKDTVPNFSEAFHSLKTLVSDAPIRNSKRSITRDAPKSSSAVTDKAMQVRGGEVRKSRWPEFVWKIYEFFEKKIAPAKFRKRHAQYAKYLVERSPDKIKALKDFRLEDVADHPDVARFGELGLKFPYVPHQVMLSPEERRVKLRSKAIGSETAVLPEHAMYKSVAPLSAGGITVKGYKVNADKEDARRIRPDRVIPTSFKKADSKAASRNRLVNCYMAVDKGRAIMRTGVIDTPEKASEFFLAARELNAQKGGPADRPIRVVSHQLNSPEVEKKMISGQHRSLLACAQEHEDVEMLHLNTPCNRFYHATRTLESYGLRFLKGEKKSRENNIEGMARYLVWLVEDMARRSKDPALTETQRNALEKAVEALQGEDADQIEFLKLQLAQISEWNGGLLELANELDEVKREKKSLKFADFKQKAELNKSLKAIKSEVRELQEKIAASRRLMSQLDGAGKSSVLPRVHDILRNHVERHILAGKDPVMQEYRETAMLYRKLLGNQVLYETFSKGERLDRGQELMMFQLLNQRMNVVSAVNCKSGLDRTGFVFAMMMGLLQCPEDKAVKIAANWNGFTSDLNQKMREYDYDLSSLYQWLDEPVNEDLKETYRAILDMRLRVFDNLLNVSLPITAVSTGLMGLKWGSGMNENLIPLNFLPPVVQIVMEDGRVEQVRILDYGDDGQVKGLTETGHRLLTQLSPRRGA